MTPEQFVYWLQGFLELGLLDGAAIGPNQAKAIKEHLATVFQKTTPPVLGPAMLNPQTLPYYEPHIVPVIERPLITWTDYTSTPNWSILRPTTVC